MEGPLLLLLLPPAGYDLVVRLSSECLPVKNPPLPWKFCCLKYPPMSKRMSVCMRVFVRTDVGVPVCVCDLVRRYFRPAAAE